MLSEIDQRMNKCRISHLFIVYRVLERLGKISNSAPIGTERTP